MKSSRHCPYCNSTAVIGLGACVKATCIEVELRCCDCGNLFISEDRRQAMEDKPDKNSPTDL